MTTEVTPTQDFTIEETEAPVPPPFLFDEGRVENEVPRKQKRRRTKGKGDHGSRRADTVRGSAHSDPQEHTLSAASDT